MPTDLKRRAKFDEKTISFKIFCCGLLLLVVCTSRIGCKYQGKGAVKDKLSKEPLIGATIRLIGTPAGAVTDMDGNFELNAAGVLEGMYDIEIKYVGYKTEVRRKVRVENGKLVILNLELETDAQELSDVVVVAKKNRENENMLLLEQQKAVIAVQSVGVKELSRKGVSDAEGAVTKVSGISKQDGVKTSLSVDWATVIIPPPSTGFPYRRKIRNTRISHLISSGQTSYSLSE